jgi:hypothetical protein
MPSVLVCFVHRPIGGFGHRVGVMLERTPEVRYHAVDVVHRLNSRLRWTVKQDSPASKEWLHVILHIAEVLPYQPGNLRLSTKPRKRCFQSSPSIGSVICPVDLRQLS